MPTKLWFRVFLILLFASPVPLMGWLGEHGIRSLEEARADAEQREALASLQSDLALALERLEEPSRPVQFTSLEGTVEDLSSIRFTQIDATWNNAALLQAREHASAGRDLDALEALEPLLQEDSTTKAQLLAWVECDRNLSRDSDAPFIQKARSTFSSIFEVIESDAVLSIAWNRWARIILASWQDASRGLELTLDWMDDIEGRATDLEELALLGELATSLNGGEGIRERLHARTLWAQLCRELLTRFNELEPTGPLALHLRGDWFVIQETDVDGGHRVDVRQAREIGEWLANWRSPQGFGVALTPDEILNEPLSAGRWTMDPGHHRLTWRRTSETTGWTRPRLALAGGLLVYAALATLSLLSLFRRQSEAARLAETRGELIARVTHELRTPLSILRMYSETLNNGHLDEEARKDYLRTIHGETQRLGTLVDRVAEAARDEAMDSPTGERVSLVPLVRQVLASFQSLAEEQGGRIHCELDVPVEIEVLSTPEELRSILETVLENSFRYAKDPVHIHVHTQLTSGTLQLAIRDHGPGLTPDDREKIFDPWHRGSRGRESAKGGAGMGLYLARRTARARGGELTLENAEGGGALARLTLPCLQEACP